MRASFRGRLLFTYLILVVLALTGMAGFNAYESAATSRRVVEDDLRQSAVDLQKFVLRLGGGGDLRKTLTLYQESTARLDETSLRVVDARGQILLSTAEGSAANGPSLPTPASDAGTLWSASSGNSTTLHLTIPLKQTRKTVARADLSRRLDDSGLPRSRTRLAALVLAGLLTALAVAMASAMAQRILQPVTRLRRVADEITVGKMQGREPIPADDEFAELGSTILRLSKEVVRSNAVTEEKNKLDAILSSMVDGVITIRSDGTITFANATAGRFISEYAEHRRSQGEDVECPQAQQGDASSSPAQEGDASSSPAQSHLVGRNLYPFLEVSSLTSSCLSTREAVSRDMRLGESDINLFAIPLSSVSGNDPDEVLFLLRDVSSLRQVEIARSHFLGNVSHELKTPLTIIKGFVVTLQKSPGIPEEWKRYLDFIDRETDRLTRLVNDLLNLARLRSKRTQMSFTFCDPAELLQDTYRQLLTQASLQDVTLSFEAPAALPVLLADADRFKEIVLNLVDNAFKYSPPKTQVTLEAHSTEENLVVVVRDNGPGIPAEEVTYLFERFFRGSDKGGRRSAGSGIGLAIVKEIVDAHRGSIRVESSVGVGTSFIVELPLRRTERRKSDVA